MVSGLSPNDRRRGGPVAGRELGRSVIDSALTLARCHDLGATGTVCTKKRTKGTPKAKKPLTLGLRWPVERTNSWFSNFGQLRRNTDRFSPQRLG